MRSKRRRHNKDIKQKFSNEDKERVRNEGIVGRQVIVQYKDTIEMI